MPQNWYMAGKSKYGVAEMSVGDSIIVQKNGEPISLGMLATRMKALAAYYQKRNNTPFKVQTLRVWSPVQGVKVTRIK